MTAPAEDSRARIRSYLLAQAEAKGFSELRPAVEDARAALFGELTGVSEEQAAFKPPGEGEAGWSILETLRHVVFEEEDVGRQILALAQGQRTEGTLIGRVQRRESATLSDLARDMRNVRTALMRDVEALAGVERLDVTAPHPWFWRAELSRLVPLPARARRRSRAPDSRHQGRAGLPALTMFCGQSNSHD